MTFATEIEANQFIRHFEIPDVVVVPSTHAQFVVVPRRALKRKGEQICSICGEPFREFSNNAQPVNAGRCCNYCDDHVVTPARIARSSR